MKKIKSRAIHVCVGCGAKISLGDECFSDDASKTMGGVYMYKNKYYCLKCGETKTNSEG